MAGITDDTKGQWIVLCGLTISLSLVLLAVLANEASVTGYYSSYLTLEFPKEQIRDLIVETRDYAKTAAETAWELNHTSNETVLSNFTRLLSNYSSQVSTIHSAYGNTVNISISKIVFNSTNNSCIDIIWLNIYYDDGTTYYASEPEIIEVGQ
jgi:hypothetical protein